MLNFSTRGTTLNFIAYKVFFRFYSHMTSHSIHNDKYFQSLIANRAVRAVRFKNKRYVIQNDDAYGNGFVLFCFEYKIFAVII